MGKIAAFLDSDYLTMVTLGKTLHTAPGSDIKDPGTAKTDNKESEAMDQENYKYIIEHQQKIIDAMESRANAAEKEAEAARAKIALLAQENQSLKDQVLKLQKNSGKPGAPTPEKFIKNAGNF